jgi:hypothetical protein
MSPSALQETKELTTNADQSNIERFQNRKTKNKNNKNLFITLQATPGFNTTRRYEQKTATSNLLVAPQRGQLLTLLLYYTSPNALQETQGLTIWNADESKTEIQDREKTNKKQQKHAQQ